MFGFQDLYFSFETCYEVDIKHLYFSSIRKYNMPMLSRLSDFVHQFFFVVVSILLHTNVTMFFSSKNLFQVNIAQEVSVIALHNYGFLGTDLN